MVRTPHATGRRFLGEALPALLMCWLMAEVARGQCHYTYQFIYSPPNSEQANPRAINNLGHVAGSVEVSGTERGFIWTPEGGTQLLPMPPGGIRMQATGINDLDHICGWMDDWAAQEVKAFLWDGSEYTFIHNPYPNERMEALDVNNHDQVVGFLGSPDGRVVFFWENGLLTELNSLIGVPEPRRAAINDNAVITGHAGAGSITHAWVLEGNRVHWLPEGGLMQTATNGLSNSGDVVGWGTYETNGGASGCVWDAPSIHLIAPPSGFRHAPCQTANNAGRVGGTYIPTSGPNRGFVWQAGTARRLSEFVSGISVGAPMDINEFGQVAAYAGVGPVVLTPVWKAGDLTGDCAVGLPDLLLVLQNFGSTGDLPPRGDVDLNGTVELSDLALLLSNWGI